MKTVKLILIFLGIGLLSRNTFANDSEKVALFKKSFVEFLSKEGYVPRIDSDGEIVFKSSGRIVNVIAADQVKSTSEGLLFVTMHSIYSSEGLDDLKQATMVSAINKVNLQYRVVKGAYSHDRISFSIEVWVPNSRQLEQQFAHYMSVLESAREAVSAALE